MTIVDKAHVRVRQALKSGELVRPSKCETCQREDPKRCDGRSGIHAHHENYDEPLNVKWLCVSCHLKLNKDRGKGKKNGAFTRPDRVRRGEQHGMAKITKEEVFRIRRELGQYRGIRAPYGILTEAGQRFGLHRTTMRDIIDHNIWKEM